jgi:hypothetical protein
VLSNDRTHVDPNNVPLASLVAQEEHVDVNFIRNNNFNNNAYGTILLVTIISRFLLMVIIAILVDLKCLMKKGL